MVRSVNASVCLPPPLRSCTCCLCLCTHEHSCAEAAGLNSYRHMPKPKGSQRQTIRPPCKMHTVLVSSIHYAAQA